MIEPYMANERNIVLRDELHSSPPLQVDCLGKKVHYIRWIVMVSKIFVTSNQHHPLQMMVLSSLDPFYKCYESHWVVTAGLEWLREHGCWLGSYGGYFGLVVTVVMGEGWTFL